MKKNTPLEFRKYLHRNPELSNYEKNTARYVIDQISKINPDKIIENIGGNGIAFLFGQQEDLPTVMFRAELDALPIQEESSLEYKSENEGIAHLCGHDGHMSILFALAHRIAKNRDKIALNIVLLFQPAEETGEGAERVVKDKKFINLSPDYIFALHNLPGFKLGNVILRNNTFASASQGLIIKLKGKPSHAGHPENGINPIFAMMNIMKNLDEISQKYQIEKDRGLITIIHVKLGEIAFGTSPGEGTVMATFRAYTDEQMNRMSDESLQMIESEARKFGLKLEIEWTEKFPATVSNNRNVLLIKEVAKLQKREIIEPEFPFSWSEDFSYFSQKYNTAFMGLGSGEKHPQLHNSNYDFPDELINVGCDMFWGIIERIGR